MKSRILNKRQIAAGTAAVALCAAVFLNWYYTKQENITPTKPPEVSTEANLGDAQYVNGTNVTTENDYFTTADINRTKAHDSAKEYLKSIISDSEIDAEEKEIAKKKLTDISDEIKAETDIQNLITARLNCKCMATLNDSKIEIVVPKGKLTPESLIAIKDIVLNNSNVPADNITVIELK